MYIVGKTGTGKSMLLLNMLVQDLELGDRFLMPVEILTGAV